MCNIWTCVSLVWACSKISETKKILEQENFGNIYSSSSAIQDGTEQKQTEAWEPQLFLSQLLWSCRNITLKLNQFLCNVIKISLLPGFYCRLYKTDALMVLMNGIPAQQQRCTVVLVSLKLVRGEKRALINSSTQATVGSGLHKAGPWADSV